MNYIRSNLDWISESVFYDIDTGEFLNVKYKDNLESINYVIVKIDKKFKIDNDDKKGKITREYGCRFTGQRSIEFEY